MRCSPSRSRILHAVVALAGEAGHEVLTGAVCRKQQVSVWDSMRVGGKYLHDLDEIHKPSSLSICVLDGWYEGQRCGQMGVQEPQVSSG
jgi:hypothetical protein